MIVAVSAFVTAIVVVVFSTIISRLLEEKIWMAIGYGAFFTLFTWIICRYSTKVSPVAAMLFLVIGLITMVILAVRWYIGGSTIKELFAFVVMDFLLMQTAIQAAKRVYDLTSSAVTRGVVISIPKVFFLALIAFFIFNMMQFKDHLKVATVEELDEDLDFYKNPLKIFDEVYTPYEDLLKEDNESDSSGKSEDSDELEESEDECEPIDFGLLNEEGGIEYVS